MQKDPCLDTKGSFYVAHVLPQLGDSVAECHTDLSKHYFFHLFRTNFKFWSWCVNDMLFIIIGYINTTWLKTLNLCANRLFWLSSMSTLNIYPSSPFIQPLSFIEYVTGFYLSIQLGYIFCCSHVGLRFIFHIWG